MAERLGRPHKHIVVVVWTWIRKRGLVSEIFRGHQAQLKRLFAVPNLNAHAISNVFTPVWRCLLIPYYASSDKLMDNIPMPLY